MNLTIHESKYPNPTSACNRLKWDF